jgi:lysozyme
MTSSAQGIDISAFQDPLTLEALQGYSFCFAKATEGVSDTDANFAANWHVLRSTPVKQGAYHELWTTVPATEQAAHFLSVVRAQGLEPGDMLAVVASDYAGVTAAEVLAFADTVAAAAPACPLIIYSDRDTLPSLAGCTKYDLWVAWPSDTAPEPVAPWDTWRFWQWDETTLDKDAYNGTAADLESWLAEASGSWVYGPPQGLKARGGHTNVELTWTPPAGAPEPPAGYSVFIYEGSTCDLATLVLTYPRQVTGISFTGGSLKRRTSYTAHVVAEGSDGSHIGPDVYASVTFTTG